MSIKILHQIIDYDKSVAAWGRYQMNTISTLDVTLIKHYDTQADAILAASPQLIQTWAAGAPGDPSRIARGAAIALDRKAIYHGEAGTHQVSSQNGNGTYTLAFDRCTCPDWRPAHHCKHELAVQARALLDEATITLTTNCRVTGNNKAPIIVDQKLIAVQEGTDTPRKPRNPEFMTAVRWLLDRDYELYQAAWSSNPYRAVTERIKRYHYIPMTEAA